MGTEGVRRLESNLKFEGWTAPNWCTGRKETVNCQSNLVPFFPDLDYLHWNGDNLTELGVGYGIRETDASADYPGGTRGFQDAPAFFSKFPTLIETLDGSSFEGQQHSGYHD